MKLTLTSRALISITLGAAALTPLVANAAESEARAPAIRIAPDATIAVVNTSSLAEFEGRTIDLSKGWDDATACWVDEAGGARCYRTEAEMDKALAEAGKLDTVRPTASSEAEGARASSCSSSLRLYSGDWFSGYVLYLSERSSWITLSWYAFDNVTSSYRIGGCGSSFRSGSYGSGSTYSGATTAWSSSWSMPSWDDVLSSVYIF